MNNEYKNLKYYNQKKGILKRKIAKRNTSNFEMLKYKEKYNKLYNQDKLEMNNFPNLNSISIQNNNIIPFITERTSIENYKRFYHSRNLNNNNSPIKILSIDDNYNSLLTKTDDSIKNKSNLSLNYIKRKSMENLSLNIDDGIRNNNFTKFSDNSNKYLKYGFRKNVSFNINDKSNLDLIYNGYKPNFNRIKHKNKKKISKKVSKYLNQLSKISESDNNNNSKTILRKGKYKKSISINPQKRNIIKEEDELNQIKIRKKKTFEISSNKIINLICNNNIYNKKISESENSYYSSEEYIINEDYKSERLKHRDSLLKYICENERRESILKLKNKLFYFENEIRENIIIINENSFEIKKNLIQFFIDYFNNKCHLKEKEIYKKYEKKIIIKFPNKKYINELKEKKEKSQRKILLNFEKKIHPFLHKKTIKNINIKNFFNISFSNTYLLEKYLSIEIDRLIIKERYLTHKKKYNSGKIINNFSNNMPLLRRAAIIKIPFRKSSILEHLIPNLFELPFKDSSFLLHFYQIDNEYNIFPSFLSVKIEKIKFNIDDNNENIIKNKKIRKLTYVKKKSKKGINEEKLNNENYQNEKLILKNALIKNSFYERYRKRTRRSTLKK